MKIFPIGTNRLHEPLSLIKDDAFFPGAGYFHSSSQVLNFLEILLDKRELSIYESRFFFRKDQTPDNLFNAEVWQDRYLDVIEKIKNVFEDSEYIIIEISTEKTSFLNGVALQGNPNYYHEISYSDIWKTGYYCSYFPELDIQLIEDNSLLHENLKKISELLSASNKRAIVMGHIYNPDNPNQSRLTLNKCIEKSIGTLSPSSLIFYDQSYLVREYGFRVLDNDVVDIHHLPWAALKVQVKDFISMMYKDYYKNIRDTSFCDLGGEGDDVSVVLSFENISQIDLTKEFLFKILKIPSLIDKIKKDSVYEGFWAFNKVIDVLNNYASTLPVELFKFNNESWYLFNLAYIFPNIFIKVGLSNSKFYLNLSDQDFIRILSRPYHYEYVEKCIFYNDEWFKGSRSKLLYLLFKLTEVRYYGPDEELRLLDYVQAKLNSTESSFTEGLIEVKTVINTRAASLKNRSLISVKEHTSNGRIALFISGQLRGYREALPTIVNSFLDPSKVDVFVSTWEDVGWGLVSIERLSRFFTQDGSEYLKENFSSDESIFLCKKLIGQVSLSLDSRDQIEKYFRECFERFNSLKFNSFDDNLYPFNKMNNSEKMYFHNSFWVETLGSEVFSEYSKIVKIRPDLKLVNDGQYFDQIEFSENTVYVENYGGWIFRDWGFGIGDQIICGKSKYVLDVLACHGENKISSKLLRYLKKTDYSYSGHRNCGYLAWLNGYECDVSLVRPEKICNVEKFNVSDIRKAEKVK